MPAPQKARQEPTKVRQEPTKAGLLTATSAVTIVLFILLVVFARVLKDAGLLSTFRYIVFLACGLVFAQVVFFFKKESQAGVEYKTKNVAVKLGGQAAMAALVVVGNYWLVPKEDPPLLPQGLFGYVVHGTDLEEPVKRAKLIIYGGPETQTSDSGAFRLEKIIIQNQPQTAGDPITFHVSDWVIFDPYIGERGRMYLPKPSTEPIKLRVLRRSDPAFLSGSSVEKILGHKAFLFETKSRLKGPNRRAELPRALAKEWATFLDARALEIGFQPDQLKSAVSGWTRKWSLSDETDYRKGLAALYHGDLPVAQRYFSSALNKANGDVQITVATAYTEYQMGNYSESARLLAQYKKDPVLNNDLTIVEDPTNQINRQDQDNQPGQKNQGTKKDTIQTPPGPPTPAPDPEAIYKADLDKRARQIVQAMATGNFKIVTDTYTDGLGRYISNKRQMPLPDALSSTWQANINSFGPFEGIDSVQVETNRDPVVALVTCNLQRGKVNVEIVFEPRPSHKTCNLWLQPAPGRQWTPERATNCL